MTQYLVTIIVAMFGAAGFWTLISNIYQNKKEKKSCEREMLLGLGHDKLLYLCRKYLAQGYISAEQHENLLYLFHPYKGLGGNGTIEHLMGEINKLPIKDD